MNPPLRLAHAGYVDAVAEALEAAGVPVADRRADLGPPRAGWIPFDLARQGWLHGRVVWDHDTAGAVWSEERGWYLLTVDDPHARDVRTEQALDVPVIAAPRVVARAVAVLAGLLDDPAAAPDGSRTPGPDLTGHRAGTVDPAFEEALLRYSPSRTKSVDG